jgi:hypothetical protein
MKTCLLLCALFISQLGFSQYGGLGFIDISYATIGEEFIDATSDAFTSRELQINENGIGIGANGKFFFNSFSVGGGGSLAFINSDNDLVKMNVGLGYGTVGYNAVRTEELLVNVSARLGGFGNTLSVNGDSANTFAFGDVAISDATEFTSGSFMYGAEVDVIYFIEQVTGLAIGIGAYFNAPITFLNWQDSSGNMVGEVEQGAYTHFGISLKIGGGGFSY